MKTWLSPDCRDGNHQKCDRAAWDEEADDGTDCGCECHMEVVEVEILPDLTAWRHRLADAVVWCSECEREDFRHEHKDEQ